MKVNTNVQVTVKLTDLGLHHYTRYIMDLNMPYATERRMLDAFNNSREFRTSIWDLMNIFGPIMQMGMDSPFEDNCIDIDDVKYVQG